MSKRPIVHIEVPSSDREVSGKFFQEIFGWEYSHVTEPEPYTMVNIGQDGLGLGIPEVGEQYKPGDVVIYLGSDDVAADLEKVVAAGGSKLSDPFPVGDFAIMAFFADPTGNRMALYKALMTSPGSQTEAAASSESSAS